MKIVVTGTDTGVGKTIFAAALTRAIGASYWKPIQSGLEDETDSELVARLGGIPAERILPEAYRLTQPLSPHRSAELDGVAIDTRRLVLPEVSGPLVAEGAGGLLVPVTRGILFADLFRAWGIPVVLVARTTLGTINHSLLSIEALRARQIPLLGVAFVGDSVPDTEAVIPQLGKTRCLGRLPLLERLDSAALAAAFADAFHLKDFT
ncbi:dethiobiotin synthase [Mesorhizobium comanense]|uniref:dethiobiotin synthase n=1 Tax=Mesorhizobium comanense TaxID=2502215 RepID=UPI000CAD7D39|nr:dethiobiotin synthase [Mesorhizobium comanense]PKP93603.1 MAG: ATP-dependent dethiobiotin synthetase BioD [Alphaproteobacteria bacterium HGW-Alphaproteobacteria-16]